MTFGAALSPTAYGNMDGPGTRANFDHTDPITLAAGTYTLTNFQFEASQAGDAQPVLAVVSGGAAGSGTETYTLIAVGNDTTVAGAGFNSVAQNDTFTVPLGGETVYAGFVNQTAQPVDWAFVGSTSPGPSGNNIIGPGANAVDSHFNPGNDYLTDNQPVQVGDQFLESGGSGGASATTGPSGGAYEINRQYQFNVSIAPVGVPEPPSLASLCSALSALGLIAAIRRRRAA